MTNNYLLPLFLSLTVISSVSANFQKDVEITWGDGRGQITNNGELLTLSLDKSSGSGFQSKNEYLFGKIDMQMKLVPGNSAGTVTTLYLKSPGTTWDEIDFEFLGNLSGDPYTLHTNVYTQGKGDKEQQFKLWFDPTADFHTYTILWNPQRIIFTVDGTPIREFKNMESIGTLFPKNRPMRMYSSLWNADDWATRGGLVKTDWSKAHFTASYRGFNQEACVWSNGKSSCPDVSKQGTTGSWLSQELDSTAQERMRWVQRNYMIYNYCTDAKRFPEEFDITWGDGRGKVLNNGELLTLSLDRASGSGFQSKKEYLFGKIDMQLKLVPGNSAGTVTAYYLKSKGDTWDEIDFEFLGNLTGDPYVMHTNVYTQGKGDREQQFNLWFDPTADFHTYSVLWNPHHIVFLVDGIAIRQFKNLEHRGIQYPKLQPMRLYSSLWNADQWATRGGLVKTDWSNAPFTASYRNFRADACVSFAGKSSCPASSPRWFTQKLDLTAEDKMRAVQSKFMVYNYCTDTKRFPQGVPKECNIH
ncbi:hypothetical protein Bca52824_051618 [Brassica carinata]|uniref:xyloglucan:xyloglucosyl transferase n=1 Tax=Brassica carinata TaxID=52824 RepID=A0A8X7R5Q7_BRACI|nr:hypothetical protein Bca52824_051618 [Brassica carinata]